MLDCSDLTNSDFYEIFSKLLLELVSTLINFSSIGSRYFIIL